MTTDLVTLLTAGDPLADAVVAELDLVGPRAQHALDAGLRHGLANLDARPPEAVAALLRQVESPPPGTNPLLPHRGDVVSLSVPPMWFGLCSVTSALTYVHASPAVARALTRAARPANTATRRLTETGVWARQTIRPGGLLRGGPGYVATVEVRLRHARMRARALRAWDAGVPGLPVGRLDLARTWLGFTLVAFQALSAVGIDTTADEERSLYGYWSHVAHLLGLDERLWSDVTDHAGARRLRDRLDTLSPAPDDSSRELTAAVVEAQARAMAAAPGAVLAEEQLRVLTHGVLRRTFGDSTADRLGIPLPAATDLMPLVGSLNREARYWQTYSPASAGEARIRALSEPEPEPGPGPGHAPGPGPGPSHGRDPIAAVLPGPVVNWRAARDGHRSVPAA
ncbi:oxygenase MpaB family protein [Streptomyces geranii]|uniref:oxygenase MpaB family protein n=1 Tax=Streptomyces geranii TaxID=2058923 RepID=UPI000D046A82|nr:oxygenase MpaB family protein [Streptomyces geranii]